MSTQPVLRAAGPRRSLERSRLRAPAQQAARELVGALLVRVEDDGTQTVARLVELEAYCEEDPASHSFAGLTERTEAMFGAPGTAYVYRSYGIHWCLNVTCGQPGVGAAVLLRAAVALNNHARLHERRGREVDDHGLLRGPGVLTRTLAVDGEHYGLDLCRPDAPVRLESDGWSPAADAVAAGPRVGVRRAHQRPWRFYLRGLPEVTRYRSHPRAGRSAGA